MYYLQTEKVVKQYDRHKALDEVSIQIDKGHIYGLLGPNGAGKSTLIRIINCITAPDSGKIYLNGKPLRSNDISHIGYLPEERGLYKKMKVGEQAMYLARLKGLSKTEAQKRLQYWFEKFDIKNWADKKLEELSKGMQQKVQFIITVLHQPELLILDEPFSGFDPVNAQLIRNEILQLRKEGATILLSTHNMASVEEICDEIGLINKSKLVLQGNVNDIKNSHRKGFYQIKIACPQQEEEAMRQLQSSNIFQLEDLQKDEHFWKCKLLKKDGPENTGTLFREIAEHFDTISIEEIIPSMNDIFIQTVQEA